MPDSYGKRQRDAVKARKAAAREERRIARRQRQNNPSSSDGEFMEGSPAGEDGDDETPTDASPSEEVVDLSNPATQDAGEDKQAVDREGRAVAWQQER
jgi:hypothetical protein